MANISVIGRVVSGVLRNVDLSQNTLVVQSLSTGSNTLTDAILGRLLSLQNGTDLGTSYHTHDTVYTRTTALAATASGSAGSTLIGDNNSYSNFTPSANTVKGALSAIDSALATVGKTNYSDSIFYIYNNADNTKKIAFSAASITSGNSRTITMPDANVNLGLIATAIQANGTVPFTAAQSMGGFKLTNLANGSAATDAVTYSQLIGAINGNSWRKEVNLLDSVDTSLPTSTSTTIDSVTVTNGMRVLFTNLSSGNNDVYTAAVSGSSITWTIATDGQSGTGAPTAGDTVLILSGTNYANLQYAYSAAGTWVQISGAGTIIAGNGLSKSGQTLSVVAASGSAIVVSSSGVSVAVSATGGLQVTGSALALLLADTSLASTASGVKVNLASAGGLTVNSGLMVATDSSTTRLNGSGQVAVANGGISALQLNTGAADQKTLVGGAGTALSVANAPQIVRTFTAGQSFSANTTYALRYGIPANSETAGAVYAADIATTAYDLFYVIGVFNSTTAVSSGGSISAVAFGQITLGSSDTAWTTSQIGKPVFLAASGAISAVAPTTATQAVTRLGIASSANTIEVHPVPVGVN